MMSCCPSEEILRTVGTDAVGDATYAAIEEHVEGCPACQAVLERQALESRGSATSPHLQERPLEVPGFTIEKKLGEGATGVVYLARSHVPRRQVALKVLPGGQRATSRERSHWLREAHAASQVRHPHVVTLYEVREADDCFLLVLEYVPGGTLAERITERLVPRAAARIAEIIARAVSHIHGSGLLHLDLKPSNILLDGDVANGWEAVNPKVSDFGIARSVEPGATDTGSAGPGGTPSYMAPEQITKPRKEMTAQADIHGIGAILYHMLTGRPPYQGLTAVGTIDQVRLLEPVPPRRFSAAIPRDLETICLKCLHKSPGRRYASAEALADDLKRWLEGHPITARPVSQRERAWRFCRRRPVAAVLAAALVVTLLVSFATVVVFWQRAEAHLRLSTELAGDLVDLAVGGEDGHPKAMTSAHMIPFLEKQRKSLVTLTMRLPDDLSIGDSLTLVEVSLARNLAQASRHEEARVVLLDSLERIEHLLRQHPMKRSLWHTRASCCASLAQLCEGLGQSEDGIAYMRRAIESHDPAHGEVAAGGAFGWLMKARRQLAWMLYNRGDRAQAASLFAENHRLVESAAAGCDAWALNTERLLCHIDDREARSDAPPATKTGACVHHAGGPAALSRLASPRDASQPPAEWARLASEVLRCDDPDPRVAGHRETENALRVTDSLVSMASRSRRVRDLDGARRIAERMLALAKRVAEAHPDEAAAHRALSFAYGQIYKNAYEKDENREIEANMKLARDAALKVLLLEPTSEIARHAVDDLERRLAALPKGR